MLDQHNDVGGAAAPSSQPHRCAEQSMAGHVLAPLDAAIGLVRAGDMQSARELCAAVIFEMQPVIIARAELLHAVVYVLLLAHGFKLLSRLLAAVSGCNIDVTLLQQVAGPIAPPCRRNDGCRIAYALDPRWIARLRPDDTSLCAWCDALLSGPVSAAAPPARFPVRRDLLPA